MQKDLRQLNFEELKTEIISLGEKAFRAKQIYEWLWKKSVVSIDEMTSLSLKTRELLKKNYFINSLNKTVQQKSKDRTIKMAFSLFDDSVIETVLIPSKKRHTVCISTQAGCSFNCKFCATGNLKFNRNLSIGEIYDQVSFANKKCEEVFGSRLSNIVVMGMGEPLMNYKNTIEAIDRISSEKGLGFSPSRITLSTVGITDKIKQLADDNVRFNLAISLHSANDEKRSEIMSVNNKYPLKELSKAIEYFYNKTKTRITYEYLLLDNINDSLNDAKELAEFCKISPCKINLIEYNPNEHSIFGKSSSQKTKSFTEFLESKNLIVNIRLSKGNDIDAACGQLANKN